MAVIKKYNLTGEILGEEAISDDSLDILANHQMIKDYLVAIRANARQWSASTQTRSEVNHSKKKPYAQKGTGNARQGFLGSPQFRGGGRVHAPRPKFNQHVRINRKEKRLAIRHLLGEKVKEMHAHILDYTPLEAPKTKTIAQFLKAINLKDKRVLFVARESTDLSAYETLSKSLRNVPKINFRLFPNLSGYDLALCHELIMLDSAWEDLKEALEGTRGDIDD